MYLLYIYVEDYDAYDLYDTFYDLEIAVEVGEASGLPYYTEEFKKWQAWYNILLTIY